MVSPDFDPSLTPAAPEQGVDPSVLDPGGVLQRLHGIFDDRDASMEKKAALFGDPKIRTLLETGQLDNASALAREDATGTTELPRVRPPKRKPVNRRGGRSVNEGSDSEHDEAWNAPAPELSPDEAERGHRTAQALLEVQRHDNALEEFRNNKDDPEVGPMHALAILRTQGYRPDPTTQGNTLIKIDEPHMPFKDRRPSRRY